MIAMCSSYRCLLAAKGAAWLRPWLPRRIPRASNHSSKAAARGGTSSLPAALRTCYTENSWCSVRVLDRSLFFCGNAMPLIPSHCLSFHVQFGKDSRRKGSGAGFPVTLEKCLGALSILHKKPGAQPSGTDSFRRSAGSGQGGATVRSHSVTAGYLGLLTFWKRNRKPAPRPFLQRSPPTSPHI